MNLRYLFVFLILLWLSSTIFSADEKTAKDSTVSETKTTKATTTKGKRRQIKTLEEFIPSEEVSADKPVAFPNDI